MSKKTEVVDIKDAKIEEIEEPVADQETESSEVETAPEVKHTVFGKIDQKILARREAKAKKKAEKERMDAEEKQAGAMNASDSRVGMRTHARGRNYKPNRFGGVTPYFDPDWTKHPELIPQAGEAAVAEEIPELPETEEVVETVETVETVEAVEVETVETVETVEAAPAEAEEKQED